MRKILFVVLTGCGAIKGASTFSTGASTSGGATSAANPSSSAGEAPSSGGSREVVVPNLLGKTPEQAVAMVKAAGFSADIESTQAPSCDELAQVDDGKIDCQEPGAGKTVRSYTMIVYSVHQTRQHPGRIITSQLVTLQGMTTDQARKALKSWGFVGKVTFKENNLGGHHFYDKCGDDRVCDIGDVYSGISIDQDIVLFINPKIAISAPD